jgi:hypothetical protein
LNDDADVVARWETMMSSVPVSAGLPAMPAARRQLMAVVPHCVHSARPGLTPARTVACPRCRQRISLPPSARDGDLTECLGLLMRITCDERGCVLELL